MRSSLRILIVSSLVLYSVPVLAQAVDPALTAAIAARDAAANKFDADTVAKYTADDYWSVNPNGELMNKKQRVAGLRSPAPGAKPSEPLRAETVRMYGASVAVARMRSQNSRQLFVWVKNPQGWQAAVIHIAPDAAPAPPVESARPSAAQPTPVTAPAGLTGDRTMIFAAWKQIQDAFYAGDRPAYEKSLAPEFVRISAGGMMRTAADNNGAISGFRAQPKYSEVDVRVWDQLGVVRWLETNAAGRQQWLTRLFAKKPSGWQQVVTASSVAGKPPVRSN